MLKSTRQQRSFFTRLLLVVILFATMDSYAALPFKRKINSVKSLTFILSMVEKESGDEAIFVTLKLQIYLEDLYISQGTPIMLRPRSLSDFIKSMIKISRSRKEIAREILDRYKKGDFHDR